MFVHTVYFYASPTATPDAIAQLKQDCKTLLPQIPTVRHLWVGKAAGTPRAVVDNSYAVGLTVVFDDAAGHDVYQPHPKHLEFVERNKATWASVKIYDFVE